MKKLIIGVVVGLLVGVVMPAQAVAPNLTVLPVKSALDYLQYMCDENNAMTVFLMDNARDPLPINFQYLGVQKACQNNGYNPSNLTAVPDIAKDRK